MNAFFTLLLSAPLLVISVNAGETMTEPADLWPLAKRYTAAHRFSTLFTAQDVRDRLSTDEGLDRALAWCKATAITKVYMESFRDGYQADEDALTKARDRFRGAGFTVSGCITPTQVGKKSNRWNIIACYTDRPTQDRIQAIFEYAAALFDEIMIDDFWFTDCACPECDAARQARQVTVAGRTTKVAGDTWEDYRRELMLRVSQERLLTPSRKINPRARLIVKYPQWYDTFHERGYDVAKETAAFDRIWVGTETRDYSDERWGGTVPYEAYFIMRWLGGLGGRKCGGGWYDWLGTTEQTYVEQARQTILAGARESLLFCYGGLQGTTGPANIRKLRENLPELFAVADQVRRRPVIGVAAYKPANSHPESEPRVFDFVGMLGMPLVPCHEFPVGAPAAFFSMHALKDPALAGRLRRLIGRGRPVLVTDGLASRLKDTVDLTAPNVRVLRVEGDPKRLLTLPQRELDALRAPLLHPFKVRFQSPNKVGLYLFKDGSCVVENFNDEPVTVELNGERIPIAGRAWAQRWQ